MTLLETRPGEYALSSPDPLTDDLGRTLTLRVGAERSARLALTDLGPQTLGLQLQVIREAIRADVERAAVSEPALRARVLWLPLRTPQSFGGGGLGWWTGQDGDAHAVYASGEEWGRLLGLTLTEARGKALDRVWSWARHYGWDLRSLSGRNRAIAEATGSAFADPDPVAGTYFALCQVPTRAGRTQRNALHRAAASLDRYRSPGVVGTA